MASYDPKDVEAVAYEFWRRVEQRLRATTSRRLVGVGAQVFREVGATLPDNAFVRYCEVHSGGKIAFTETCQRVREEAFSHIGSRKLGAHQGARLEFTLR